MRAKRTRPVNLPLKEGPDEERSRGGRGNKMRTADMKTDSSRSKNLYNPDAGEIEWAEQARRSERLT